MSGGSTVGREAGCDDAPGSSIAYSSADRSCGRGGETLVKLVIFKQNNPPLSTVLPSVERSTKKSFQCRSLLFFQHNGLSSSDINANVVLR